MSAINAQSGFGLHLALGRGKMNTLYTLTSKCLSRILFFYWVSRLARTHLPPKLKHLKVKCLSLRLSVHQSSSSFEICIIFGSLALVTLNGPQF